MTRAADQFVLKYLPTHWIEDIHDSRFLRFLSNMLTAGYLEAYHATLSGMPQGSIASSVW